jgi:ribose transport system ATP-binding protein
VNDESAPAVLEARHVGKTFPAGPALRGFDFTVGAGCVHALVGENGSGKSTFIKILAGYHDPDPGSQIRLCGRELPFGSAHAAYELGCRFVHQDLALIDELSVADNLSMSTGYSTRWGTIRPGPLRAAVSDALDRAGVSIDPRTPIGELSPANKTGVAVARALRDDGGGRNQARLIVMDEPTATLPDDEVRHLLRMLRQVANAGVAVLYVSHRLDEVFSLCDDVTILRDGEKIGTYPVRDLARTDLITRMVGEPLLDAERKMVGQRRAVAPDTPTGTDCLTVVDVASDELKGISFSARRGSITGFAGVTGSGREIVLSTIFGGTARTAGRVAVNGTAVTEETPRRSIRAGISYLPPERKTLGAMIDLSARENLTIVDLKPFRRLWTMWRRREDAEVRTWFEELRVRPAGSPGKIFATFSGGNQQKILFAKWMRIRPAVLLLDEPTHGVDVASKAQLYEQIIRYAATGGCVLVSSSDTEDLVTLCDRVLVMRNGRIVAEVSGAQLSAGEIARQSLGAEEGSTKA